MTVRLVLVGQAPGAKSGDRAFDGRSGDRLAAYMGLGDRSELLERVECHNLLRRYPGSAGKGDRFPLGPAARAARRLLGRLEGCHVLLAGRKVGLAFGMDCDYLTWTDHPAGFRAVVIPHPSGVNHWWNDEHNRRWFRGWVAPLIQEAP